MCDCINRTNKRFAEHKLNTKLAPAYFPSGRVRLVVATCKVNEKEKGKAMNMIATYCPFCGEKYPELTS
jgi:hypothetical protein